MNKQILHRLIKMEESWVLLGVAILIGGIIRLYPVIVSDFPINDGGMFYVLVRDLQANNYILPKTFSYNNLNLPYAYPPLAFYFVGIISEITSWKLIDFFRFFPAIFSVLTIPACYLLLSSLIPNKLQAVFATFMFAFNPSSFYWLIMGGGLTRAPAFFFALISLYFIYKLYIHYQTRDIFLTSLFVSFTILTHPETALHTAVSAVIFFFFFGRNRNGVKRSFLVAGLIIIITFPWWGMVFFYHNYQIFLTAGKTGFFNLGEFIRIFLFDFTKESNLKTIGALSLFGMFLQVSKKEFFFPTWLMIIFLSSPRSASLFISPCLGALASYPLILFFQKVNKNSGKIYLSYEEEKNILIGKISKVTFSLLFGQWVFSSMASVIILMNSFTLNISDRVAFDWIKNSIIQDKRFLVLTGEESLTDSTSEWFPALTQKTSVATLQGNEWDDDISFKVKMNKSEVVQKCLFASYNCVDEWIKNYNESVDFIYIRKPEYRDAFGTRQFYSSALGELTTLKNISRLVYENDKISIYEIKSN